MQSDLQCFYGGCTSNGCIIQQRGGWKSIYLFPFCRDSPLWFTVKPHVAVVTDTSVHFFCCGPAEEGKPEPNGDMEPSQGIGGRSFVEVMSEKYSPENFPYRRGPGMGVVVVVPTAGPQGSPMKGELRINLSIDTHPGEIEMCRSNPTQ